MEKFSSITDSIKEIDFNNFNFTEFEITEDDSDELKKAMDELESNNSILGVMGWGNHSMFNAIYKKLIENIDNSNNDKLIAYAFNENDLQFINSTYFDETKFHNMINYLALRCVPFDIKIFNLLMQLKSSLQISKSNASKIEFAKLMNVYIQRIAIDQWEAIKSKLISLVKGMGLGLSTQPVIENILLPLYEKDGNLKYATEKGVVNAKLIKTVIMDKNNKISKNAKKVIYRIARHIDLLRNNMAVSALIRLNIQSINTGFTQEIKDLISNTNEKIIMQTYQGKLNVVKTLQFIIDHHAKDKEEGLEAYKFDRILRQCVYLLRKNCRIEKLRKVLSITTKEEIIKVIKLYNQVFENMEKHFNDDD